MRAQAQPRQPAGRRSEDGRKVGGRFSHKQTSDQPGYSADDFTLPDDKAQTAANRRRGGGPHPGPVRGSASVTAVLRVMDKPGVDNWKLKKVAEFAVDRRDEWEHLDRDDAYSMIRKAPDRESQKATSIGTSLHSAIESLAGGRLPDRAEDPHLHAAALFLRDVAGAEVDSSEFFPEVSVCSSEHGYHGRVDLLLRTRSEDGEDRWHVIDWKTTATDSEYGPYPDSGLQVNAYARADGYKPYGGAWSEMPEIDSAWVVKLLPTGEYIADECLRDDHWAAFRAARALSQWSSSSRSGGHGSHANRRVRSASTRPDRDAF